MPAEKVSTSGSRAPVAAGQGPQTRYTKKGKPYSISTGVGTKRTPIKTARTQKRGK